MSHVDTLVVLDGLFCNERSEVNMKDWGGISCNLVALLQKWGSAILNVHHHAESMN